MARTAVIIQDEYPLMLKKLIYAGFRKNNSVFAAAILAA